MKDEAMIQVYTVDSDSVRVELHQAGSEDNSILARGMFHSSVSNKWFARSLGDYFRLPRGWRVELGSIPATVQDHVRSGRELSTYRLHPSNVLGDRTLWEEGRHALRFYDTSDGSVRPVIPTAA